MNTLKQSAAAFNLYKVEDIPAKYRGDSFDHRIKCGSKEIPAFFSEQKEYSFGLFYECKQDTDYKGVITYYIDNSYLLIKRTGSDMLLMLQQGRDNKYRLFPYYGLLHKFQNISHYIRKEALKGLKEPNNIGVFTVKKLNQWSDYCESYYKIHLDTLAAVEDKNKEIEDKIAAFIASVPDAKVSKYHGTTDIDTALFRVRFVHNRSERYLQTDISFKGSLNDVTNILNSLCTA